MDSVYKHSSEYARALYKNRNFNVVVPLMVDIDVVRLRNEIELQEQANDLMKQLENVSF